MEPEVSGFSSLISFLTGADAFSLLFPFILSWMLYLAAIEKASIFDDVDSLNNAAPVMAMILAFFTARFLVMQPFYQSFFSVFFGKIVIGLASILGLLTLASFTGFDWGQGQDNNPFRKYVFYIAVLMAGAAFVWAGGFGPAMFGFEDASGFIAGIISATFETGFIWLLVIAGAMLAVMYPSGNDNATGGDTGGDDGDDE
ncbi:MAG: hypothetical protein ABEK16_03725 [Candidatus Nanohalobium sp.]